MPVTPLTTPNAPMAVGPYSPAVRAGDWITCSGQVGLDPQTGEIIEGGLEAEVRQVLANVAAVLADVGAEISDVAKTTVYLTDTAHFGTVNTIYGDFFGDHRPARTTVAVAGLPRAALVEIEVLVYRPIA